MGPAVAGDEGVQAFDAVHKTEGLQFVERKLQARGQGETDLAS